MQESIKSYRRILKSATVIGGASVVNVLIGLVRTKIIAVLIGPGGIALVSLYGGLVSTAATFASMGIGTTGTRQIAEAFAKDDAHELQAVRRAIFWGALLLSSMGAIAVWSLRELLAVKVLGGPQYVDAVGWLALGVALSVASSSQGALMQGMRRIGEVARLSVLSSLLYTITGGALLWYFGQSCLIAYVLIGPLLSFLLGHWYVARLPKLAVEPVAMQNLLLQWKHLLRLGIPFMGAGIVGSLVSLWIRVKVDVTLGSDALGHFQAAYTISMQYIGFVLTAMGADYYPRLTGVIEDHPAASRLVNEQTEVALLLSAPVFIAMIGLAPWVIHLLYSAEFTPAVSVLRWQILGDILKVASWPLGFVILATGAGNAFFWAESLVAVLMGVIIEVFLSEFGLNMTGIAFLLSYAALLPMVYFFARRRIGFRWDRNLLNLILTIFTLCLCTAEVSLRFWWGDILTVVLSLAFAAYTLSRIVAMGNVGGFPGRIQIFFEQWLDKWSFRK